MKLSIGEIAHPGWPPAQRIGDAKFGQKFKRGLVGLADEMIEPLDREPVEIEMCGHPARLGRGFDYCDGMASFGGVVRRGEPHGASTDNDHPRHSSPLREKPRGSRAFLTRKP